MDNDTTPPPADDNDISGTTEGATAADTPTNSGSAGTPPPPGGASPPGASPPWQDRPLLRRDHHKHLAGVAGGLADYLRVEASVIRVAFVILAVFGIGVPLYIVGWIAMPAPSMSQSYIERWFGRSPNPGVVIAIAAAVIVLFALNDGPGHNDGFGWGLALLFGGWLLFQADNRATAGGPTQQQGPPPPPMPGTWHGAGGTPVAPPPAAAAWTPPQPRPRSPLGRITIGIALASAGTAALMDRLGYVALEPVQYAALAMTIVGIGLIVGAWAGRAYGLIGAGFLLLPVVLVLSVGPVPFHGGVGDVRYAASDVGALEDTYELGAGELELDFGALDLDGATETVAISVGAGQTTVIVPDAATVAVAVQMRAGDVDLFGEHRAGRPFLDPITRTFEGEPGAGRLELDIDNGVGEVIIRRQTQEF